MVLDKLKNEFAARAKKNPAYSMRAFAKSLEIDSSTLSSLLSGKRPLSYKTAKKLLDKLDVKSLEKKDLLFKMNNNENQVAYKFIEDDELEIISDWEHYAILSLMETVSFQSSVKFISQKLHIPTAVVMAALSRLEKVGLIRKVQDQYKICQEATVTSQDVPSVALRKAHKQYLEKAIYSLENHSVIDRDISGITIAIQKSKLPQAKKIIQDFRKSLAELLESGKKDEVYRLNIQLYPLKK